MMAESEATLDALARCHPELAKELAAVREWWDPEPVPPTSALGNLGLALVRVIGTVSEDEIRCVARIVENVLKSGSAATKAMVTTGFLEAVMAQSEREPRIARFTKELGPLALDYCRGWDKFTGCRTPGVWDETDR
jgi:hypothetical protein